MGFTGFSSTKGKVVEDNLLGPAAGAVAKHKGRKYRQYMNRKGKQCILLRMPAKLQSTLQ